MSGTTATICFLEPCDGALAGEWSCARSSIEQAAVEGPHISRGPEPEALESGQPGPHPPSRGHGITNATQACWRGWATRPPSTSTWTEAWIRRTDRAQASPCLSSCVCGRGGQLDHIPDPSGLRPDQPPSPLHRRSPSPRRCTTRFDQNCHSTSGTADLLTDL